MKKIIFYTLMFIIALISSQNYTSAASSLTLSGKIVVYGTGGAIPSNYGNAGEVTFDWHTNGKYLLDADEPYVNTTSSINGIGTTFHGNFWLDNVGWVTFDHGVSGAGVKLVGANLIMTGFARSQNAGWIAFDWNNGNITDDNGSVYYDKNTRGLKGFAWSDNLGFIPMDGIKFDIVGPSITLPEVFAANNNKTITTKGDIKTVEIEKYDVETKGTLPGTNIWNFKTAKDYSYTITDEFGSYVTGIFQVVAATPLAPTFSGSTFDSIKFADGKDAHEINIILKDTYGNIVKTVPGVKDVSLKIKFNDTLKLNQLDSTVTDTAGSYMFNNSGALNYSSALANYTIDFLVSATNNPTNLKITSFSPSHEANSYVNGDTQLQSINYEVTAEPGFTDVGAQGNNIVSLDTSLKQKLKFLPIIQTQGISNSDNWKVIQGDPSETSYTLAKNKSYGSDNVSDIAISNIFQLGSNELMSFQNLIASGTNINTLCSGFNKSGGRYSSGNATDCTLLSGDDSIITLNDGSWNTAPRYPQIKATPTIIIAAPSTINYTFKTNIKYNIGGKDVVYQGYSTESDSTIATTTTTNTAIKILGQTNKTNNIDIFVSGSTYNSIGNLSKNELKSKMIQKAYSIIKNGTGTTNIQLYTGDTTISSTDWPAGKDTIIVNGGNLYLKNDIEKTPGQVKAIIVTKNANKTGGNIFVDKDVQSIKAVLIAEGALISGNSENSPTENDTYYADTNSGATNQLYIYGSLFSNNTVGGSSKATPICPFDITSGCTLEVSKRYDLNHFRHYIPGTHPATITGYPQYPMVVKYDSDIALGKNKFLLTK